MVFRVHRPGHRAVVLVETVGLRALQLQAPKQAEHLVDVLPAAEDAGHDEQYEDLVELQVEVCDPESV